MSAEKASWSGAPTTRRALHYFGVVFRKWKGAGFVGALGAAVGLVLSFINQPLPWWGWASVVAIALVTAQYQAFADLMARLEEGKHAKSLIEKSLTEAAAANAAEVPPTAVLAQLVTQGEALVESLTTKPGQDPTEGNATSLEPAIEAWAERCRAVLQEHWPSEVGRFDATNKKIFADTFFHGTQGARLLGFMRPRLGNLKAILIRVS